MSVSFNAVIVGNPTPEIDNPTPICVQFKPLNLYVFNSLLSKSVKAMLVSFNAVIEAKNIPDIDKPAPICFQIFSGTT